MLDSLFAKISVAIISTVAAIAGFFGVAMKSDIPAPVEPVIQNITNPIQVIEQPLGATIPIAVARFETSLQASITDSATSMTLVSGTDTAGNSLSGFTCFTIDEGTSVAEDVCGTASGTAVSSLTRGISPVTGTSSVTSLKQTHRRGASIKITDHPHVALHGRILNGDETLPSPIRYDSSISTTTLSSNTNYLANISYVNGIALQGAPTATTTTPGIVQIATTAQIIAGTGMTGAYTLIPAASLFNATSSATTIIPVTKTNGKLSQGFLDLTEAWTFTATTTLAATSSAPLVLRGMSYVFPPSQVSGVLTNNGSGTLSWGSPSIFGNSTTTLLAANWGDGTTTLATITVAPTSAQRLFISGTLSVGNGTNSGICQVRVSIDFTGTTTGLAYMQNESGANGPLHPLNFTYISPQVTAATHTVALLGINSNTANQGSTCTPASGGFTQFNAQFIGN